MNLRTWLVQLYPRGWRDRYGMEFEALLEDSLHTPLDALDIFLGALDARIHFSDETNWRSIMTNKFRTTALLVFAAYIMFIVAGMSLYGFADDSPFVPMMQTNLILGASWTIVQIGSVISLLAILIGGAPLAWTIIRRAFTSHRPDLQLLLIPLYAFLVLLLYFFTMVYLAFHTHILDQPMTSTGHLVLWGLAAVFMLGALASTLAVWKVVARTDVDQGTFPLLGSKSIQLYEFTFVPAVVATVGILVMFIASVIWFWQAFSARPDLLSVNAGPMMTNTEGALIFTLLLMTASVITAGIGVWRGLSARA